MTVLIEREAGRDDRMDPMWSAEEDERRLAIYRRAAAGAKKTLTLKSQEHGEKL